MEPSSEGFIRIYSLGKVEEWENPSLTNSVDSGGELEE